jgi:hypothetical protein
MSSFLRSLIISLVTLLSLHSVVHAVPTMLNYQGRIAVNGENFSGAGLFKFALVNDDGSQTYWSNDDTSVAGSEPTDAVSLAVSEGLYSVLLGDTDLANMGALPVTVFDNQDVRLRVWFNDGTLGFQHITPDQRLAAAPYALVAAKVDQVLLSDVLAPPIDPVIAWGDNNAGQITVPALASVAAIAAGSSHSLALLKSGTLVQWGTGTAIPAGLMNVTEIAAGESHSLARINDGTVTAWGDDAHGQSSVPAGITNATNVSAGQKHSLALRADGTVTAWGDNTFGQTTVPAGLADVTAVAAGNDHNLALKADGTVVAWGRDTTGQSTVPAGLANVVSIAAGAYHSLAVQLDGAVVAWGWDSGGQSTVPAGLNDVTQVAGGYTFSLALRSDGTLVAWGDNADGQTTIPDGAVQITSISAGTAHALALQADLIPAAVARLDQDNVFTGKIGINRTAAVNVLEVEGQASKSTAGNWSANSDARIKTEIQPLTNALEKLNQVRLVDFRYTEAYRASHPGVADKRYLNVIAQEFAKVFPDHVQSSGEKLVDGADILQVDTYPLTIYSAAAVQELHRENETLRKELAKQNERLIKLESALLNR